MATQNQIDEIARRNTFVRLVAAYEAADRREMYFTQTLIGWNLLAVGATIGDHGQWLLDGLPAAGVSQPY